MRDPDPLRDDVAAYLFRRLAVDPSFRDRLPARAPDGSHHIIVALPTDLVREVADEVRLVGGSSNLVAPYLNGFFVVAMTARNHVQHAGCDENRLTPDCTVGLLMERLRIEGPSQYCLLDGPGRSESGSAELVALAERH